MLGHIFGHAPDALALVMERDGGGDEESDHSQNSYAETGETMEAAR